MKLFDTHTHHLRHNAWVNRSPGDTLTDGYSYSIGVHPWEADRFNEKALIEAASNPLVKAIGETGIDMLRGPEPDVQEAVFRRHAELSETLRLPLIIHCVKAYDRIMAIRREIKPEQPWIIHGFRGKPQLARQLLNAGFHISLGPRFNPETARIVPGDRLHIETDDSTASIEEVAKSIEAIRL